MYTIRGLFFLILSGLLISACRQEESSIEKGSYRLDEYTGTAACINCHQTAYNDWRGSHHDWAMKRPDDSTVLGNFNDQWFTGDSVSYFFSRRDSSYYVTTVGDDGKEKEFQIAYTFGVTPLQQYLIELPEGKYQTLRATWNTEKQVWFNQYPGRVILPDDWLHWSGGGQRWNTMCAECHSTNLEKNYFIEQDSFNTIYSAINVSCEACHGPMRQHLRWAEGDTTQGDPKIQVLGYDQQTQLQLCAGCHARRTKLTDVMSPAVPFADQFLVQTINAEYYHPDGQIKEEDYVYGSFLQSKMYQMGVKCSDCHNVHSMELKFQGNNLCLQCHEPANYDNKKHHFHEMTSDGAQCVSCHMTGAVYMGNDFRRDHSFRIPRPDQSVEFITPNACTGCHKDKTDQWAADWVVTWYGPDRTDHFSDHLLPASRQPYSNKTTSDVLSFINNMKYPAIARATALEYFPLRGGQNEYEMIIKSLADSSALVRYHALSKLGGMPLQQVADIALAHINDDTRLVRIGAVRLIVELDVNRLEPALRGKVLRAREDLSGMLKANADFPLGRLQMGDMYIRQNRPNKAIKEYEMALKMDALLTPVYSNLATAYNMVGKDSLALLTLDRLLELEPGYGRGYYLRGLLKYELNDTEGAIADLSSSVELDPGNFRAYYNLANLLLTDKQLTKAEKVMVEGLLLQPESPDGLYLLALIYQGMGRDKEAEQLMKNLDQGANVEYRD
jgi:tetratricopeptide (TPR) repeat protein